MKFRFSLQKALDWTEVEENAKRLEIARLIAESERLRVRRLALDENLRTLLGSEEKRLSIEWAPYAAVKVPVDQAERVLLQRKVLEKEAEITAKKAELNRLLLKRKGLDSLRDKRHRDHRIGESRREQKQLDDNYQILRLRVKNG